MFEVSYVKEEGVSIKKHERVYAKETGYATNIFKEGYAFLGFATRHSPKRHKNVVTTYETKGNSESGVMMQNRGGKRFGQFNEMLQRAKEGKSVVYASMLGSFEIRYIQPEEHHETYFDEAEPGSDKYGHTLSVWNSKNKEWEAFPIKNLKLDVTGKRKEFIDTLCRGFDVNNVKEMSEQMQNFGYKPGETIERKLEAKNLYHNFGRLFETMIEKVFESNIAIFSFFCGILLGIIATALGLSFQ